MDRETTKLSINDQHSSPRSNFYDIKHTTILIRIMLRAEEGRKRSERRNKCRNFPSIYVYLILNNNFIISENNLQKEVNIFRMGQLPSENFFRKTS